MKIAVIGTGTVGVMTVCHLLHYTPDLEVDCIFNPTKNILGIGESSNVHLPDLLYKAAGFNTALHSDELDVTFKYGVKYVNWRKKDFFSPIIIPDYALHFDNFKLADVIFKRLKKQHQKRFNTIEGDVKDIIQNDVLAQVKVNDKLLEYDFVVDCRGYPEDYSDYEVADFLPLNHAIVHGINQPGNWNYTYHQATKNGWMFGIPLQQRQGWGYLFNDNITDVEDAKKDMASIFNISVNELNLREFTFKPYRTKKFIDGRILRNGNRAIFYEPIEAISGVFYDNINSAFYQYIHKLSSEDQVNYYLTKLAQRYENFICYAYHGGSIYDTPFWKDTKQKTSQHLQDNYLWKETIENAKNNYEFELDRDLTTFPFNPHNYKLLDQGFGYSYFSQ